MIHIKLRDKIVERNSINKEIEVLKKQLAEKISPYKVGDIIETKGYWHQDKKCRVTGVALTIDSSGDMDLRVSSIVLKKDSTDSSFNCQWSSWHDDELKLALETIHITDIRNETVN